MKRIISLVLVFVSVFSIHLIYLNKNPIILAILCFFIFCFSMIIFVFHKKAKKSLMFLSLFYLFIFMYIFFVNKDYFLGKGFGHKLGIFNDSENYSVDIRVKDFESKILSNYYKQHSNDVLNRDLSLIMELANKNLDESNPESYYTLGKIYNIAYTLGIENADSYAVKAYDKYCDLGFNLKEKDYIYDEFDFKKLNVVCRMFNLE